MDKTIEREIGIWILLILGAFGTVLIEHISQLGWTAMWIWFIGISWYLTEGLVGFIIYHYFKVSKQDLPAAPI